jgi:tRNA pseudouridine55 synthase
MMQNKSRFNQPAPPRETAPHDGVLIVDKPAGMTSHDVVDVVRKVLGIRRVGHGGTLDPRATGLLIILTGKGTKLSNRFLSSDKTYLGTLCLGVSTDSQDADGSVTAEADCSAVTRERLEDEMRKLTGDLMQTPPMVSAVKVDGVPLYKHARRGKTVERKSRLIHVYEFALLDFQSPRADFIVRCTKGTYVRTLCADVGEALGCGAHLAELRRTESGELTLEDAIALDTLRQMSREELCDHVIPVHKFSGPRRG